MSVFYDLASLVLVPSGYKAEKVYAQKPLTADGQLTFSRASTATRVNASGLVETVSSNVPRLDYTDSTCPKLLLEPQRTNVLTYSEQFNNAVWATDGNGAGEIKTANYSISPDGYQDADRIQLNRTGGTYSRLRQDYVAAGNHTGAVYLKSNTGASQKIWMRVNGAAVVKITITTSWQRFVVSQDSSVAIELFIDNTDAEIATIADFSAWGAQLEAGAYATSYIPTPAAAVTRLADACSKTGITSLIGQTAGTVFVEFEFSGSKDSFWPIMTVMGASSAELIEIYGSAGSDVVGASMFDGGATQFSRTIALTVGRHKLAIAYELNNTVAYLDGTVIGGVDTSCTIPTMTEIALGKFSYSSAYTFGDRINQALLFKTRLTNAQLAEITQL